MVRIQEIQEVWKKCFGTHHGANKFGINLWNIYSLRDIYA